MAKFAPVVGISKPPDVHAFVERIREERRKSGLPATIVDLEALRLLAALTAGRGGGRHDVA